MMAKDLMLSSMGSQSFFPLRKKWVLSDEQTINFALIFKSILKPHIEIPGFEANRVS